MILYVFTCGNIYKQPVETIDLGLFPAGRLRTDEHRLSLSAPISKIHRVSCTQVCAVCALVLFYIYALNVVTLYPAQKLRRFHVIPCSLR